MKFLSVCSGIEAASVAWNPLGWKAAAFSEIEPFPCAVLAHHYPDTPNHGDMTKFKDWPDHAIDLLCGGTPCQSFSVAGLRKGLADPRGNLMLTFGAIAAGYRPRWLVWENVPGVLSSNGGGDFGAFLGMLGQLGYGFAYRVLDAQYAGLAQRRKRVFVVGCLGDWRSAAAVLFERHSLQGHPAPRREKGPGVAALTANGVGTCGADDNQAQAGHLIAHALTGEGFDASEDGTGRGTPLVPVAFSWQAGGKQTTLGYDPAADTAGTLVKDQTQAVAMAFKSGQSEAAGGTFVTEEFAPTLQAQNNGSTAVPAVMQAAAVRRLTPRECARLQGFPDDYLDITYRGKPAADGPKYKALGNSWAVPVVRWIGERIEAVEAIAQELEAA